MMYIAINYKDGTKNTDAAVSFTADEESLTYFKVEDPAEKFKASVKIPTELIDSFTVSQDEASLSDNAHTLALPEGFDELKQEWIDLAQKFLEDGYTSEDIDDLADEYDIPIHDSFGIAAVMDTLAKENAQDE